MAGARHGEARPEIKPQRPKASAFSTPAPPAPAAQNHPLTRIWRNYPQDGLSPAWHPSSWGILLRSGQGGAGAVRGPARGPPGAKPAASPGKSSRVRETRRSALRAAWQHPPSSLPWQKSPKSTCKRSSKARPRRPSPQHRTSPSHHGTNRRRRRGAALPPPKATDCARVTS